MPKQKLTDEQKEEAFNTWLGTSEVAAINKFIAIRGQVPPLEMGVQDISDDYQPYLAAQWQMVQELKVPGRKAKAYEQQYVRTMFFDKLEAPASKNIDGVNYPMTLPCVNEIWNCKEALVEIYNFCDPERIEHERQFDNYSSWRKDLVKMCKEWDKIYVKHSGSKGAYKEMAEIHAGALKPLTNLIDANVNFQRLEKMIATPKTEVPEFRQTALEEQFCEKLTIVNQIFKDYGSLEDHFDIRQMIKTLKISDWQNIKPFWYFLTPLLNSINAVRDALTNMHKLGHLRIKYIVEDNDGLVKGCTDMIKKDYIAQWLMGDQLKQDQFKFIYDTTKIVYDSALRSKLLEKDPQVVHQVIPSLCALQSILVIRDIQLRKAAEVKHAKEKAEREGGLAAVLEVGQKKAIEMTEEEIIAQRLDNEKDPNYMRSEAQKLQDEEEQERKVYGRFWIWEGYYNMKNQAQWLELAEDLKNINDMVLQDIQDYILLKGFKGTKPERVRQLIEDDHQDRIHQEKRLKGKEGEEYEAKEKLMNKNRKFLNTVRPPDYWNFFEDCADTLKVRHVLRYNARPTESYKDGRVEKILDAIDAIGHNLERYEEPKWKLLLKYTLDIFDREFQVHKDKLAEL